MLILSAPDPTTTRTWEAVAAPMGEDVFAIAICYNPKGAFPGPTGLSALNAIKAKAIQSHAHTSR
jgi:hypothetical protein